MLFKGSLITAASGKAGGLVAAHNAGGQYLRQFAVPTNPNSTLQQQRRTNFGNLSTRWSNTLTQAQRDAWNAIASTITAVNALGDPILLSGQQAYMRASTIAMLAAMAPPDDAPSLSGQTDLGTLSSVVISSPTQVVGASIDGDPAWAADDDGALLVFVGDGMSPARTFYRSPFQFADIEAGNTSTPVTTLSVTVPSGNKQIVSGLRYWIRVLAYLNGQVSQAAMYNSIAI